MSESMNTATDASASMPPGVFPPRLSVVIPVYNEEPGLQALFDRLYPALDALGVTYEVLFINDGSGDRSAAMLKDQFLRRPEVTRVILFGHNYGQHMAIVAGFEHCRGERIVTLDADLQNPPEEIAKLLAKMDEGHDYVGSIRRMRQDAAWRRWASKAMNRMRERITHIRMTDQGCMLRAYSRPIVEAINSSREVSTYIPALAYSFGAFATDDKLTAAAARARLLPWIESLPQGWDTQVGAHGAAMSGGERQRLALARALLADPALLVLDEPTAHLDPGARCALTADLLDATRGRSTLLITHDMQGLDQVDEIIVLDHGEVAQRGTHQQLLRADGPYRQMREPPS